MRKIITAVAIVCIALQHPTINSRVFGDDGLAGAESDPFAPPKVAEDFPFDDDDGLPEGDFPTLPEVANRSENSAGEMEFVRIRELENKLRNHSGKDKQERAALVEQLSTLMQKIFDADFSRREESVVKLEERVAKLRASLDTRKAARDRIIKNRIDGLVLEADGLAFPFSGSRQEQPTYSVRSIRRNPDGSSLATILMPMMQTRSREESYIVTVPVTRTRTVNGKNESYVAYVQETRTRRIPVTSRIPNSPDRSHTFVIPKGKDVQRAIKEFTQKAASSFEGKVDGLPSLSFNAVEELPVFDSPDAFEDDGGLFDNGDSSNGDDLFDNSGEDHNADDLFG